MGKIIMNNFNTQKIQLDIANWTSQEPYAIFLDIERKIKNRLQKKYKLKIDPKILEEKIRNYKAIYNITKENLPKYTFPSESGYSEPQYIKNEEIKKFLTKRFPSEDEKILDIIISWVVYYEYLR